MGKAEIAMGNREAGIEAISRAAEMDPENADYARELLRLAGE